MPKTKLQMETVQRLFNGKDWRLCVDQYGNKVYAKTAKELAENMGRTKARRIYRDGKDGKTYHCGYIVAGCWFEVFSRIQVAVTL